MLWQASCSFEAHKRRLGDLIDIILVIFQIPKVVTTPVQLTFLLQVCLILKPKLSRQLMNSRKASVLSRYQRVVFNGVSKVIARLLWFCITTFCCSVIGWQNSRQFLGQWDVKPKPSLPCSPVVFPRLAPVTCIRFEFWLVHCAVCTCCDWSE